MSLKRSKKYNKKRNSKKKSYKKQFLKKSDYSIKKSTIKQAGDGAFSNIEIKKNRIIGCYKGKKLNEKQYQNLKDDSYIWSLSRKKNKNHPEGEFYIDGKPKKHSNWTRYINHSTKNSNLEPYQYKKKVCFRTKTNIIPNKELFYDYGDEYW